MSGTASAMSPPAWTATHEAADPTLIRRGRERRAHYGRSVTGRLDRLSVTPSSGSRSAASIA
jgi:hypothetical protein